MNSPLCDLRDSSLRPLRFSPKEVSRSPSIILSRLQRFKVLFQVFSIILPTLQVLLGGLRVFLSGFAPQEVSRRSRGFTQKIYTSFPLRPLRVSWRLCVYSGKRFTLKIYMQFRTSALLYNPVTRSGFIYIGISIFYNPVKPSVFLGGLRVLAPEEVSY